MLAVPPIKQGPIALLNTGGERERGREREKGGGGVEGVFKSERQVALHLLLIITFGQRKGPSLSQMSLECISLNKSTIDVLHLILHYTMLVRFCESVPNWRETMEFTAPDHVHFEVNLSTNSLPTDYTGAIRSNYIIRR